MAFSMVSKGISEVSEFAFIRSGLDQECPVFENDVAFPLVISFPWYLTGS